jgi:hypothetical protein
MNQLKTTPGQLALLADLKQKVDTLSRLIAQAEELAAAGKHGALVVLDVAPRASFEVVKTLIAARKAFGIYKDTMEDTP